MVNTVNTAAANKGGSQPDETEFTTMKIASKLAVTGSALTLSDAGLALAAAPSASAAEGYGCTYTNSQPTLSNPSSGTAVYQVQCELNRALSNSYATLNVDGSFGSLTQAKVRAFQTCIHYNYDSSVAIDGVVGPVTWNDLNFWAYNSDTAC